MRTVAAVFTAQSIVESVKQMFTELVPDCRVISIIEDALIQDVIREGQVTPAIARRLVRYYLAAQDTGADLIFNTCSSIGDVAIMARSLVRIPHREDRRRHGGGGGPDRESDRRPGHAADDAGADGPAGQGAGREGGSDRFDRRGAGQRGLRGARRQAAGKARRDGDGRGGGKWPARRTSSSWRRAPWPAWKRRWPRGQGKPVLSSPRRGVLEVKETLERMGR